MNSKQAVKLRSTKEMAARYGVSQSTFLLWYHSRIIPAETDGKKNHQFDPEKVEAALLEHSRTEAPPRIKSKLPRFDSATATGV